MVLTTVAEVKVKDLASTVNLPYKMMVIIQQRLSSTETYRIVELLKKDLATWVSEWQALYRDYKKTYEADVWGYSSSIPTHMPSD